jgi:hypothetical protein
MERQKYLSVSDIVNGEEYPFTLGQMRHYLAMRHKNGLTVAVRKNRQTSLPASRSI